VGKHDKTTFLSEPTSSQSTQRWLGGESTKLRMLSLMELKLMLALTQMCSVGLLQAESSTGTTAPCVMPPVPVSVLALLTVGPPPVQICNNDPA
jgi:hypothetical protein